MRLIPRFITLSALLILGTAFTLPAAAQQRGAVLSSIARSHYDLGHQYLRSGLTEKALEEFRSAAAADSSFVDAHLMAASLSAKTGKPKMAILHYEDALRVDRRRADVQLAIGDLHRDLGDSRSARMAYIASLTIDPNQPRVVLALAQMAMKAGDFAEAVRVLENAMVVADNIQALSLRAYAEHRLGRLDQAAALYRKVLAREPENGEVHLNLGILEAGRGNNRIALESFQNAAAYMPDKGLAYRYLGIVQMDLGDRMGAAETLRKAARVNPSDPVTRFKLAELLLDMMMPSEALEHLEAIRATGVDYRELPPLIGRAYLAIGDPQRARVELERALRAAPNDTRVMVALGESLHRLGMRREAIDLFERALAWPGVEPRVYRSLAEAYSEIGDAKKALKAERSYADLVAKAEINAAIEAERRVWRDRFEEIRSAADRRVAAAESTAAQRIASLEVSARERVADIEDQAARTVRSIRAESDSNIAAMRREMHAQVEQMKTMQALKLETEIQRMAGEAVDRMRQENAAMSKEIEFLRSRGAGATSADRAALEREIQSLRGQLAARDTSGEIERIRRDADARVREEIERMRRAGANMSRMDTSALMAEIATLRARLNELTAGTGDARSRVAELSAAVEKERALREEAVASAERIRAQSELAVREMNKIVSEINLEVLRGMAEIGADTSRLAESPIDRLKFYVQNVRLAADARVARAQLQVEARLNDVRTRAESEVVEILRATQIQVDRARAQAAEETRRAQMAADSEIIRRVGQERERLAAEALAKRLAMAEQMRAEIEADAQLRFLEEKSSIEATYEADRIRMQRDYDRQLQKFEVEYQRRLEAAQLEAKRASEQVEALTRNDTSLLMRSEVYQRLVRENAMSREDLAGARRRMEELGLERENLIREADGLRRELANIQGRLGTLESESRRYQGIALLAEPLQRGVNINTATLEELQVLPGIGVQEARNIIWYRENVGLFRGPEELVKVPGLEATKASSLKGLIKVR